MSTHTQQHIQIHCFPIRLLIFVYMDLPNLIMPGVVWHAYLGKLIVLVVPFGSKIVSYIQYKPNYDGRMNALCFR